MLGIMAWRSFPDPDYVPDHGSGFLTQRRVRRWVLFYEIYRCLMIWLAVLILCFSLFLVGIAYRWNTLQLGAGFFLMIVSIGYGIFRIQWLGKVPLKCSGCLKSMEYSRQRKSEIFYICRGCKRYVDPEISEAD